MMIQLPATRADTPPRRVAASSASTSRAPIEVMRTVPLVGDARFAHKLDLSTARLQQDHYTVDAEGRVVTLTLDPQLQQTAEAVLRRARARMAAAVVIDMQGRILALAGRREGAKAAHAFDLPIKVWAPAASVFKIVTAAALVESGVNPTAKVCFHGGLRSVRRSNLTDSKRDRRCKDLGYGLAKSQNAILAKLSHRHLRPSRLRSYAKRLGFEARPHFALAADKATCDIPSKPLAFARVAAGFWKTRLSVLQGALLAHTVASGGLAIQPRIVDRVADRNGATHVVVSPPGRRVLRRSTARALTKMLIGTTEYGTARRGFADRRGRKYLPGIEVAGKTGTLTRRKPSYMQYSWFVGYAPAHAPKVAFAVLLGNPPKWHLKAHTAARLILQKALRLR